MDRRWPHAPVHAAGGNCFDEYLRSAIQVGDSAFRVFAEWSWKRSGVNPVEGSLVVGQPLEQSAVADRQLETHGPAERPARWNTDVAGCRLFARRSRRGGGDCSTDGVVAMVVTPSDDSDPRLSEGEFAEGAHAAYAAKRRIPTTRAAADHSAIARRLRRLIACSSGAEIAAINSAVAANRASGSAATAFMVALLRLGALPRSPKSNADSARGRRRKKVRASWSRVPARAAASSPAARRRAPGG